MQQETTQALEQTSNETFDLREAINLGKSQTITSEYKGIPFFIVPNDMKLVDLADKVNEQLPQPYSLKQNVELLSLQSFIEYFNRYSNESSTIFVNDKEATFTAVIDYHESQTSPAWKRHTAIYKCPKTKEWSSWIEKNNHKFDQEEFALFIEDNLKEIVEPEAAVMLEIASTLKAKKDVDFKSGVRIDNGQVQFTYSEIIQGNAGATGQLEIPELFKLNIAPFLKGTIYAVQARFRWRMNPSGLSMWYTLIRPHACIDDALNDAVTLVEEQMEKGHLVHAVAPN
jgi:uncharacterized protein YfdQ (DUF2303 family)